MAKLQYDVKHPPSRFCLETSTSILGNADTKIEIVILGIVADISRIA